MGMHYNITFHNALIKPESYAAMIGWTPEAAAAEPERVAELALAHVTELLGEWSDPVQDEDGILMDGDGFNDSASYGYGEQLSGLLAHCEPGAYIHEIDDEESSGEQWRILVMPDRTVKVIQPVIIWPGIEGAA
ncbi:MULTISPECIES: hypothetical protein [unclassified Microbacterium]|uniref:hypothetical protein n=1 Tax=unclassified Microbacterium TaxID=2609290 RepID=UPI000EA84E81|nr:MULTISPECIES: hypothetical protein [unclassified Microbacterium]MBT2484801.1 hypothetical protein [Microbacterium sp. ISL-108]RKN67674.1 hypothetical protein D7252_08805 [Microbacterium sp. CGR2]